jgi:hypothetical protein
MNYRRVARAFKETSRRRELLSFRHHTEVAALKPEDADRLLDWYLEGVVERKRAPCNVRELQAETSAPLSSTNYRPIHGRTSDAPDSSTNTTPRSAERDGPASSPPDPIDSEAEAGALLRDLEFEKALAVVVDWYNGRTEPEQKAIVEAIRDNSRRQVIASRDGRPLDR